MAPSRWSCGEVMRQKWRVYESNDIGRQEQSHTFFVPKNVWGAPVSSRPASVANLCPMARLSGNTLTLGDTIDCG